MGCLGPLLVLVGISAIIISHEDGVRCIALILVLIGTFLQLINYTDTAHLIPGIDSNGGSDDGPDNDPGDDVSPF